MITQFFLSKKVLYCLVGQWYSSFYWRDFIPTLYTISQKQKILENSGGTCGLPKCITELENENSQFLHIRHYVDYNQEEESGLVICNQCFDKIRNQENYVWKKLREE